MNDRPKQDQPRGGDKGEATAGVSAHEHSEYAKDHRKPDAEPEERGDYCDPVKTLTGRGNASKGPWKQQGGAGYGRDYGARKDQAKPEDGGSE